MDSRHVFDNLDGGICECGRPASNHIHHLDHVPWCKDCKWAEATAIAAGDTHYLDEGEK